jgi:3-deoxy-D-manno-octulosonate 8-phosphate phosphatase (KDO 8-P phosphatase)
MEEKLRKIKAFAFDVDGVLTDGGLLADLNGEFYRVFDAKDGMALRMASMQGYGLCIITGGRSQSITRRFIASGIREEDIYLGSRDKMEQFTDYCTRHSLAPDEVMYFGDDLPDMPVMAACGCGVCPSDAVQEAKDAADYISDRPGGKLCVRQTLEMVMKAQEKWKVDRDIYHKMF